jgi:predicted transcriptional regulator
LKLGYVYDAEKFLLSSYEGSKSASGMEYSDAKRFLENIIEIYETKGENNKVSTYKEILQNQYEN